VGVLFGMGVVLGGFWCLYMAELVGGFWSSVFAAVAVAWMAVNCARRLPHHTPSFVIYSRLWLLIAMPWYAFTWLVSEMSGTSGPTTGYVTLLVVYFAATVWVILGCVGGAIGYAVFRTEATKAMRSHGWHPFWDNELLMPWPINPDSVERRRHGVTQAG
jgi:hypothetical protein